MSLYVSNPIAVGVLMDQITLLPSYSSEVLMNREFNIFMEVQVSSHTPNPFVIVIYEW
jgi:hypothetical protein